MKTENNQTEDRCTSRPKTKNQRKGETRPNGLLFSSVLFLFPCQATASPADQPMGMYFHKKTYVEQPLPSFNAAKPLLPEPVLPSKPEWVAMYWKCWQLAFSHLRQPPQG